MKEEKNNIKILLIDVETSPNLGFSWGKWEQNIIKFEQEWHLLCFSYKYLGDRKIHSYSLPDFPLYKRDRENDKELAKKLYELMDGADVLLAQNGDNFDVKKINSRLLFHGLKPPSPFKTIDTLKIARKYFKFNSNSLDDLCEHLGIGKKIKTDFDLWLGCMHGDKKSWKAMVKYNKMDISLLEKLYYKFLPWIQNGPNMNVYNGTRENCPACGSANVQMRGFIFTAAGKYKRFQCMNCGHWSRASKKMITVDLRG